MLKEKEASLLSLPVSCCKAEAEAEAEAEVEVEVEVEVEAEVEIFRRKIEGKNIFCA